LPFLVVMIGFARSYWLAMTDAPFRQHLHGLTATAWFVLLILQPWLVTNGHAARHRLVGMLALLLAGGVIASGLAAIPYNLVNERLPDIARYGLSFGDVILVSGFTTSVVFAVRKARNVDDHAHWMISTVFWALPPATFRLGMTLVLASGMENPGSVAPLVLIGAGLINLPILVYMMWREKRAHPAYLLAAVGSLMLTVALPVGAMNWWINVADAVFTI
jgi:hypothetical protein